MSLKVGDEVVIWARSRSLGVVVRETKTLYIVAFINPITGNRRADELRFNRTTLRRSGDTTWESTASLHALKPGDREAIVEQEQRRMIVSALGRFNWSTPKTSKLLEITAILERKDPE
jgi:hypothetical protein